MTRRETLLAAMGLVTGWAIGQVPPRPAKPPEPVRREPAAFATPGSQPRKARGQRPANRHG